MRIPRLLIAACTVLAPQAARALTVDLSGAKLKSAAAGEVVLGNVRVGELHQPVWAKFAWSPGANALILSGLGDEGGSPLPLGRWNLRYSWGCTGTFIETPFDASAGGTFTEPAEHYTGKWTLIGGAYTHRYDAIPTTIYTGVYDGAGKVTGTISGDTAGPPGCFELIYGGSSRARAARAQRDSAGAG